MNNVFILGAGASKEAGAPVMKDFLDKADEIYRINKSDPNVYKSFNDVFDSLTELQTIYAKSYLDLDNIEVLFGAIEMAKLLEKLGKRDVESIRNLRNSVVKLIVKTLEFSINFQVRDEQILPPHIYDQFVKMLYKNVERSDQNIINKYSIITFNYDMALDFAFDSNLKYYDYGLNAKIPDDHCPLLKLHGSINWGMCNECDTIVPLKIKQQSFIHPYTKEKGYTNYFIGSALNQNSHDCNNLLDDIPVIVPPTWNKSTYHFQIINVWKNAIEVLQNAENIFIIGYSLPETDAFFRYLFALGTDSLTRIKSIWIFNPDYDGTVELRFEELIGKGIGNRLHFENKKFSEAIPILETILKGKLSYLK
ncbi:MAG: hypothetical protein GF353_10795 [Candidatus Lokiarchaeota archaeon]|nr:hypothetical protein [Candidatus Lokiarchaeota archaeon]